MSDYTHSDFDVILMETQKAFRIRFKDKREAWVPMSVIADHEDYKVGDSNGTISIKTWFVDKERL